MLFSAMKNKLEKHGLTRITWDMKPEYIQYLHQMDVTFWDCSFEIMIGLMETSDNIVMYKRMVGDYYCVFCTNTLTKAVTLYGMPRGPYIKKKVDKVISECCSILFELQDDLGYKNAYLELIPEMYLDDVKAIVKGLGLKRKQFKYSPDFVFSTDALIKLEGRDYKYRRQIVNRFKRENPTFEFAKYDNSMRDECVALYERWCNKLVQLHSDYKIFEQGSYPKVLDHFDQLGLTSYVLKVDGDIIAALIIDLLCNDTCCVLYEYTDIDFSGSSEALWYESLRRFKEEVADCSFENDADAQEGSGLYKYKMSHKPVVMETKYTLQILRK